MIHDVNYTEYKVQDRLQYAGTVTEAQLQAKREQ